MGESVIGGRYRLRAPLGGAMSEVYLAEDLELGRTVVVKLLGPDAERARFEREARAAAALGHENIVLIYAYGETDGGRPFMVLEHLAGGTLEERLAGGALPDGETLRVARQLAAGLAHAHARGLVHRDLKPANVLFDDEDRAKIADFGIARLGGAGTITEAGTVLGTAAYISPEQAAGDPATPASDVYSFGVMLFRMLTGRLPFVAEEPAELVRRHQLEPAPSVSELRPDVPARLESLLAAALAKDPADRPSDGAALLAELEALPGGEQTLALAAAPAPRRRRRRVPLPVAAAVLAVLAVGGVALALVATHEGSPATSTSNAVPTHAARTHPVTTEAVPTEPATTAAATVKPRETTTAARPATTSAPATTTEPVTTEPVTLPATTAITTPTTVPPPPPPTPGG